MRPAAEKETGDASLANDFMLNQMASLIPKGSKLGPALPENAKLRALRQSMALSVFGIKASSCHSGTERDSLWTCRLSLQGTRVVAIVCATALQAYMQKAGGTS